jgi:ubiquinone/menaquinone biosynthesis C-methylase UbiE
VSAADQSNLAFWNELCGTALADQLGIGDDGAESLKRFDDWYFDYYPYLYDHIPFGELSSRKVLEIGLGYGTVAQRLMEAGADYHGLDIAQGPVSMGLHRANLLGKSARIEQGSALAIPYPKEAFDFVVSIGCLHHTGDLALALRELHRVLKSGKQATIMVYNALSYRHWLSRPVETFRRLTVADFEWSNASSEIRQKYDVNREGSAAPSTTFISRKEAKEYLLRYFSSVRVVPRNIGEDFFPARHMPRSQANSWFEPFVGLDLYIECTK